ncbi:MAG: PorT family protein [Bacteroidales bacterium]|nr:PorT family protein [Bacteroidales bacterium]
MKGSIIRFLVVALFCAFMVQDVAAQRFIGSVVAGANFAQIEGDNVHGFTKVGFNGGLGLTLPVNRKQTWMVSIELLYSMKGSVKHCSPGYFDTLVYPPTMFEDVDRSVPFDPKTKCNISLDYVQIPVLVHYEDKYSGCSFGLGFSWGRLVRAHEVYNGFTRTTTARSGTYKKSDWSVIADVNIRLYKNLNLNFRWEYSIVPIRTWQLDRYYSNGDISSETFKFHNHVISTRLIYYINEKFYENTRVNKYGQRIGVKWLREVPEYNN